MFALIREHHEAQTLIEVDAEERRRRGVAFRELAHEYLGWLEEVRGAKPSTLRGYRSQLAERGQPYRRGKGRCKGLIMAALGDRPAGEITTREVEQLMRSVAASGAGPRTVNTARQLVCAIFNYGMRESTYGLQGNPAARAERRVEPDRRTLAFYSSEEVEELASALADGEHRSASDSVVDEGESAARAFEDAQDAELVRIAAYTGLRRGELVALKWRDVSFPRHKVIVRRAVSAEVELNSTKSRRAREVPLPDQAAAALDRLSRRVDFTSPDDYVFVNRLGRRIDGSALRRRFERARDAAGLEPLRFHDLRHTYGSLLIAGGSTWPASSRPWGTLESRPPSGISTPGRRARWPPGSPARWEAPRMRNSTRRASRSSSADACTAYRSTSGPHTSPVLYRLVVQLLKCLGP